MGFELDYTKKSDYNQNYDMKYYNEQDLISQNTIAYIDHTKKSNQISGKPANLDRKQYLEKLKQIKYIEDSSNQLTYSE